jgi:hypothetical protein
MNMLKKMVVSPEFSGVKTAQFPNSSENSHLRSRIKTSGLRMDRKDEARTDPKVIL